MVNFLSDDFRLVGTVVKIDDRRLTHCSKQLAAPRPIIHVPGDVLRTDKMEMIIYSIEMCTFFAASARGPSTSTTSTLTPFRTIISIDIFPRTEFKKYHIFVYIQFQYRAVEIFKLFSGSHKFQRLFFYRTRGPFLIAMPGSPARTVHMYSNDAAFMDGEMEISFVGTQNTPSYSLHRESNNGNMRINSLAASLVQPPAACVC